jgi:hypothetical protein
MPVTTRGFAADSRASRMWPPTHTGTWSWGCRTRARCAARSHLRTTSRSSAPSLSSAACSTRETSTRLSRSLRTRNGARTVGSERCHAPAVIRAPRARRRASGALAGRARDHVAARCDGPGRRRIWWYPRRPAAHRALRSGAAAAHGRGGGRLLPAAAPCCCAPAGRGTRGPGRSHRGLAVRPAARRRLAGPVASGRCSRRGTGVWRRIRRRGSLRGGRPSTSARSCVRGRRAVRQAACGDRQPGAAPRLYLPAPLGPAPALALYLRSRAAATAQVQPVRDLVRQLDPRVPILEIGSLDEINERSFGPQLWLARAAGVLGAMLLASGIPALRASRVDPVANLKDG